MTEDCTPNPQCTLKPVTSPWLFGRSLSAMCLFKYVCYLNLRDVPLIIETRNILILALLTSIRVLSGSHVLVSNSQSPQKHKSYSNFYDTKTAAVPHELLLPAIHFSPPVRTLTLESLYILPGANGRLMAAPPHQPPCKAIITVTLRPRTDIINQVCH